MNKCGECVLGVRQGAICENCQGTTFVVEPAAKKESTAEKVKRVVKKAVAKKTK